MKLAGAVSGTVPDPSERTGSESWFRLASDVVSQSATYQLKFSAVSETALKHNPVSTIQMNRCIIIH